MVTNSITILCGVKGAMRVTTHTYATLDEAKAKALRWSQSNSQGHYWAQVKDADGKIVAKYN